MLRFFLKHPRMLAFGVLMTLFSSFGQTFLISIFVPRILESFGLGTAAFGMLYASATLVSAFTLPFFGRLIDRVPLRRFSLAVGIGLAAACFGMALSRTVPLLFLYLSLVGVSQGMAGPVMSAMWAEVYGVESLGATKGIVATFGVTATALGPLLLGAALGAGMGFPSIIGICLAICAACTVAAIIGRALVLRSGALKAA